MSRVQISYIGFCYAILIMLLGCPLLLCFIHPKRYWLTITVLSVICLSLTAISIGFLRRHRWTWYATWVVGVVAVILGGVILVHTTTGPQIRDSGEAWPIGIIMIGFALGALWNLATSELDRFIAGEET